MVLEWLYRPGGPIMKKAELHFYNCSYKANYSQLSINAPHIKAHPL